MSTAYRRVPYRVAAVRWTGDNYAEVRQFLVDNGVAEDDIRNEDALGEYREFRFEAWGNDMDVDPGRWIVIDDDSRIPEDARLCDSWTDDEFRCEFEALDGAA